MSLTMGQTMGKVRRIASKSGSPDSMSVDGYRISWEQVRQRDGIYLENPQWLYTVSMEDEGPVEEYPDIPF